MDKEALFKGIVDFYAEVAGADYKGLNKVIDIKEKQTMKERREKTEQVQSYFFNFVQEAVKDSGLIMIEHKGFLDGTRRRIKDCFWVELREESSIESPESISIFLEKPEKEIRIRVSTDIYEAKSTRDLLSKHNAVVLTKCPDGFQYFLNKGGATGVLVKGKTEAGRMIDETSVTKVQACKIFDVNNLRDDVCKQLKDAILRLLPIYETINN